MLAWAIPFLIVALISALFGFGVIVGGVETVAQLLFSVFIVLFLISLIAGISNRPLS